MYFREKKGLLAIVALLLIVMGATFSYAAGAKESGSTTSGTVTIVVSLDSADPTNGESNTVSVAKEFVKTHPNVKFEWVGASEEEHRKQIKMMAESNTLPDLFWESFNETPPMAKMGVLADITSEINGDAAWKNSFNTGALDNVTINGKIYGVPEKEDIMGFFYNKALFDAYNLKIPTTWDELLTAVKVLKQNNIVPIAQGTKDAWSIWGYNLFFHRYGYLDFHSDFVAKKAKFHNDNMIKAFGRIQELAKAGAFPVNLTTVSFDQAQQMFMGGKAAIFTTGTWGIQDMEKEGNVLKPTDVVFNWGPTFPDGVGNQKIALKEYSTGLWVGAGAKKDPVKFKALMDFLKFRASPEGTKIIVEKVFDLPTTKYMGDLTKIGPLYSKALAALNDDYRPSMQVAVMNESSFAQPFWNAITGVMNGLMTPEQAADSLDQWNANR